jgi:plastocyanin
MRTCTRTSDYWKELIPENAVKTAIFLTAFLLALALPAPGAIHFINVESFRFDADDNDATQVDTVTVSAGDTVEWDWVQGFHTITSGASSNPEDNPGDLFDASSDSDNPVFQFVFTVEGDVPYFCRPHEGLNMKGVIRVEGGSGIGDESGSSSNLPASFSLSQNHPNPFNPVTTISFDIAASEAPTGGETSLHTVSLEVYDVRGRKVTTLFHGSLPAGSHRVVWNGRGDAGESLGSGVYLYRLRVDAQTATMRMVLAR